MSRENAKVTGGSAEAIGIVGDHDRERRVHLELAGHPFFFATLHVPQARSRPGVPHPLVEALVAAARQRGAS